jgi:hypothetical protein
LYAPRFLATGAGIRLTVSGAHRARGRNLSAAENSN